jgi:hypothetical protein
VPTRFPLPITGAAAVSPAYDAGWESEHASFGRWRTAPGLEAGSLSDFSRVGTSGTTQQIAGQWVTDPLAGDQTISGTFDLVIRAVESVALANAALALCLRVIKPDLTVRGVLFAHADGVTPEFPPTDPATVIVSGGTLSPVDALAGDRIAVELGPGDITLDESATIRLGAPAGVADFALTAGLTTDLRPWLEFSQTLTFAGPETAAATGSLPGAGEEAIRAGGKFLTLTLIGDTWVAAGAAFDAQRQPIINGIVSAQSEVHGWNAERANIPVAAVVRTSDTVATITLPALPAYDITSPETLTDTIPAAALVGGAAIVAAPSFQILGQAQPSLPAYLPYLFGWAFNAPAAGWEADYWTPFELALLSGPVVIQGAGTAQLTLSGSAAGQVLVQGAGGNPLPLSSAAAGQVLVQGAGTAQLTLISGSEAVAPVVGAGTAQLTLSGAAAGVVEEPSIHGEGAAQLTLSGSAAGQVLVQGAGSAVLPFISSGAGNNPVAGAGTASLVLTTTAAGVVLVQGAGAATLILSSSGVAVVRIQGAGAGVLPFTSAGAGVVLVRGAGTATLVLLSSGEGGSPAAVLAGTALLLLGSSGAGKVEVRGAGQAQLQLSGSASGQLPVNAQGSVQLTLQATAAGQAIIGAAGAAALTLGSLGAGAVLIQAAGQAVLLFFSLGSTVPPIEGATAEEFEVLLSGSAGGIVGLGDVDLALVTMGQADTAVLIHSEATEAEALL